MVLMVHKQNLQQTEEKKKQATSENHREGFSSFWFFSHRCIFALKAFFSYEISYFVIFFT